MRIILALAFVMLACGSVRASEQWLLVSDTHVNPFDRDASPATFEHDSNAALLDSTLKAMRGAAPHPELVLIGGDFLAHHFPDLSRSAHGSGKAERDAESVMRQQAHAFNASFPQAPIVVTLGNNDDPCGDYHSEVDGSYMRALASMWGPLAERNNPSRSFEGSFAQGGYGVVSALHGRVRIITLNAVYWSFFYGGACTAQKQSPGDLEMAWLAKTLAQTPRAVKNIVLMHIPPGIDSASTQKVVDLVGVPFWRERYRKRLVALFANPKNNVLWAVAGHTHRTDMRIIGGVPMLLAGAMSARSFNQPTFFVLDVDDDGRLRDIHPHVYNVDTNRWSQQPSFDRTWGVKAFDATSVRAIHDRLAVEPALRDRWFALYRSNPHPHNVDIGEASWRIYWCAQTFGGDEFPSCSGAHRLLSVARLTLAGGTLVVILAVIAVVYARRRRAHAIPSS